MRRDEPWGVRGPLVAHVMAHGSWHVRPSVPCYLDARPPPKKRGKVVAGFRFRVAGVAGRGGCRLRRYPNLQTEPGCPWVPAAGRGDAEPFVIGTFRERVRPFFFLQIANEFRSVVVGRV